jgi:hypothetical protein
VGDERDTLRALLQYQRESVVRKVAGLDETVARRQLVGSGTTLLWLLKHLARAETLWIVHRFAGTDDPVPEKTRSSRTTRSPRPSPPTGTPGAASMPSSPPRPSTTGAGTSATKRR